MPLYERQISAGQSVAAKELLAAQPGLPEPSILTSKLESLQNSIANRSIRLIRELAND